MRILRDSPPIPEYMFTFRDGIDPAFKEDIRKALIDLKDPAALAVFRAENLIPAVDADVDRVRQSIAQIQAFSSETAWAPQ